MSNYSINALIIFTIYLFIKYCIFEHLFLFHLFKVQKEKEKEIDEEEEKDLSVVNEK